MTQMNEANSPITDQLACLASRLQEQRTGHPPTGVSVVLCENTLVVTLHDALTPAEMALSQSEGGAAHVREFHRQLFANSNDEMRLEINRITGRQVREAAAELETATGMIFHAFTTGSMAQVFLLAPEMPLDATSHEDSRDPVQRANDDGLRTAPEKDAD